MTYRNDGEMELSNADDANIPVNIFITWDEDMKEWSLTADNFMPRRNRAVDNVYVYRGDDPEELRGLVKKYVLPLYEIAVAKLESMIEGKEESLYYWTR